MIRPVTKSLKGVFAVGTLSWATYYKHLNDTGEPPNSIHELSILKTIKGLTGMESADK